MAVGVKNPVKMVHVNKRRLQSYEEFIQGYTQYKEEKEKNPSKLHGH
ncbi:hypothetical protein [Planococcus sp. ISL-109]|nr:hypothetical protein [Planococcus sp. ISL-109]MBT2583113.1 hypothetical protein [Planococcus sp. ISL-109]